MDKYENNYAWINMTESWPNKSTQCMIPPMQSFRKQTKIYSDLTQINGYLSLAGG